jgi:hypothetical protein
MKIYVACGLTHVPRSLFQDYAAFLHQLAASLREAGQEVKYALVDSDPQLALKPFGERARLCYVWDREMVEEADLIVAEASFPSTGLGIEMQLAEARDVPIVIAFKDFGSNKAKPVQYENPDHRMYDLQIGDGYVSLLALGIPSVFRVLRYEHDADGMRQILETVSLLDKRAAP